MDAFSEVRSNLTRTFREYPEELSGRFVQLFAGMAAISQASRNVYGDAALTQIEIGDFLKEAAGFFNSFTHK